jgi:fucose permease
MELVSKPLRGLFLGLFAVFTLFGTSMTIIGATLPKILADFSWSYAAAGAVIAANAAAYFLSTLASGKILKRLGPKATIVMGIVGCVLGLALFASSPSFVVNLLLNATIGAGQGLIEPALSWAALRMDEKGSGKPMNLMHGGFSIGAVAGPVVLGLLVAANLSWVLLFRALAGLLGILGLVLAVMPFSRISRAEAENGSAAVTGAGAKRKTSPAYWLGFLCLLLYVGAEIGITNWIAEYFVRIFKADAAFASLTVSLFWIGLLAGRFGVPFLYRGKRQEALLVASSLLLVAATAALCALGFAASGERSLWLPSALTFLAGLGCSIIYPTVVSLVGVACEERQTEAVAFAIAGGGAGLFAFPFIMSWISQGWGIKLGFASYAFVAGLTAAACALLAKVYAGSRKT